MFYNIFYIINIFYTTALRFGSHVCKQVIWIKVAIQRYRNKAKESIDLGIF
jgi:hypothetical protein